jgi:Leucine-rich repeat (LRR) protein
MVAYISGYTHVTCNFMDDRYKLNLLYEKGRGLGSYYRAQEITEEVFKSEKLLISTLAMDLPSKSNKYRKELEIKWIDILRGLDKVTAISLRHRVNQQFFEAVCKMRNLKQLHFWTSTAQDISAISNLSKLKKLYLDSFSQLKDISPLQSAEQLEILSISNSFKIGNYEVIGKLTRLIALGLHGDQTAPKRLRLRSLKPFSNLKRLRHLDLTSTSVIDKSYEVLLELKSLERFDTTASISKPIRDKIKTHPGLKSGFFMDWDWDNNNFFTGKDWSV